MRCYPANSHSHFAEEKRALTVTFNRTPGPKTPKIVNRGLSLFLIVRRILQRSNDSREETFLAGRIGVLAKIFDDLEQALLVDRLFKDRAFGRAEQSVAGQPQDGIVAGGRPLAVTPLDELLQRPIPGRPGADPKPGQNDIDGEVTRPGQAQ